MSEQNQQPYGEDAVAPADAANVADEPQEGVTPTAENQPTFPQPVGVDPETIPEEAQSSYQGVDTGQADQSDQASAEPAPADQGAQADVPPTE